jgi:hypothetical protein
MDVARGGAFSLMEPPPAGGARLQSEMRLSEAPDIPGADAVVAWFGHWPTFHDAEVLSIFLDRTGESRIAIQVFEKTPDVASSGRHSLTKPATVTFCLEGFLRDQHGITNNRIEFFNHQNVLSSVTVTKTAEGHELVLDGIYGVDGAFHSERMSVKLESG